MTKSSKVIAAFSLILLTGLISCGKSGKQQPNNNGTQDTTKTDSTATSNNSGKLEAKVKHMVQYTKIKNPEMDYCDSSRVEIDLVEVSGGDKTISDKINNAIVGSITSKEYPTIDALLHANDKLEAATYKVIEMSIVFIDDNVLSVKAFQIDQECGYDVLSGTIVLNFDLKTGSLIKFTDCVTNENKKAFEKIAGEAFIAKYKKDDFDIKKPTDFKVNEKFSISNQGITFYFDKYEVGVGSSGEAEILVPYAKFKALIIAESIISKY